MGGLCHLESLRDRLVAAHVALASRSWPRERRREACAALGGVRPADFPTEAQRGTCRLLRRYLPPTADAAIDADDLLSLRDCTAELIDQLETYLARAPHR